MNRVLLILSILITTCLSLTAQGVNYQAVVRVPAGMPLANQEVTFRFSYAANSDGSDPDYVETFVVTTNDFGLANLVLLTGTVEEGNADDLNFATTRYYLQTELDVDGGTNYEVMGTEPLRDVPYARYAEHAPEGATNTQSGYSRSCATSGGIKLCAWTIGEAEIELSGSGSAGYELVTNSLFDPLKIVVEGNNLSTTSQGEFSLIVKSGSTTPVGYFNIQVYAQSNNQVYDHHAIGVVFAQQESGTDMIIRIPGVAGFGTSGFRLIMN